MSFASKGEQFSDQQFLSYAELLLAEPTGVSWEELMDGVDSDPTGANLMRYPAHILGAAAMQMISPYKRESDNTGLTILTASGMTKVQVRGYRNRVSFAAHAAIAATSNNADYPHITLSRAIAATNHAESLNMLPESFTLPLVDAISAENYPSPHMLRGALSTVIEASWAHPGWVQTWPPVDNKDY